MAKTAICGWSARGSNCAHHQNYVSHAANHCITYRCLFKRECKRDFAKREFSGHNVPLTQVFTEVKKQTGYVFIYTETALAGTHLVTINIKNAPLEEFLQKLLVDQPVKYTIDDKTILLSHKSPPVVASGFTPLLIDTLINVKAVVRDADGHPLKGISVMISGTVTGTVTDESGRFVILVGAGRSLIFSSVEYSAREFKVLPSGNPNTIVLEKKITGMQEVVVNKGYYTETRKLSTGSVGTVNRETIEQQPVTNVLGALIGRVPGLEITQGGGMPGSGFKVRIRGQNSIAAGNNPLYIVDGVPFSSESLGHYTTSQQLPYVDGNSVVSPFNTLAPSDIANVEVLKDADATAIYGSRGANGVILITTRKGKAGQTQYDFQVSTGMSKVTKLMEMVSTQEYLTIRKEAFANDGITEYPSYAHDINGEWDQKKYTDWNKELMGGTAHTLNVQAAVSGGSEQTQFLLRSSYQKETTVFPGDFYYARGSVLLNVNHSSATGRFKMNMATTYSTDDNNMIATDLRLKAMYLAPNSPDLYQADGSLNWANSTWDNPLGNLIGKYDGKSRIVNTNLLLDWQVARDLQFKTSVGFSDYRMDEYTTYPSSKYDPAYKVGPRSSYVYSNVGNRQNWIIEPQLNWKKKMGRGLLQALIGTTFLQQTTARIGYEGIGFPSNSLIYDLTSATTQIAYLNENLVYKYQAFFGRINFNWEDKYLLNVTARRDGSSRFSTERQFANFGAIGAAWIFYNERSVQKGLPWLSFGKLRSSYGISGNDQIGDYQFLNTYATNGSNYEGTVGLLPQRLYNPDFGWESNKKLEVALELGLFKDRLSLTAAWYRNRSSNQLVGIPLSAVTGYTSIQSNLEAVVQNTGLELEFQVIAVKTMSCSWTTSFNITIPRNKLISFPGLETSSYSDKYIVGKPLSVAKLYNMTGVDPQTGIYQYEDVNHDGQLSSTYDRIVAGDLSTHYYAGWSNNLVMGKWQLDIFFQGVEKTAQNYLYTSPYPGNYISNFSKEAIRNRWTPGKTDATMQIVTAGYNEAAMTAWNRLYASNAAISEVSSLRLKHLALNYQLKEGWIKGLKGRLFIQGQNLITLTNFIGDDPELEFIQNLPQLKTLTVGVQLTF